MNIEDDDEDAMTEEEARSVFTLPADFSKKNDCQPKPGEIMNEFDEILWEMALAVEEYDGDNLDAMKEMVEGWIVTEDTDYCHEVLANEVEALIDIDELCHWKKAKWREDEDDGNDEGLDAAEGPKKACDSESVNALAAKLKALSVEVDNLGNEFSAIAVAVNDASDNVCSAYWRIKSTKQKKGIIQGNLKWGHFWRSKKILAHTYISLSRVVFHNSHRCGGPLGVNQWVISPY